MKQYRIDGAAVHGIFDLYEQFNRELMADEDWRLGSARLWTGSTTFSIGLTVRSRRVSLRHSSGSTMPTAVMRSDSKRRNDGWTTSCHNRIPSTSNVSSPILRTYKTEPGRHTSSSYSRSSRITRTSSSNCAETKFLLPSSGCRDTARIQNVEAELPEIPSLINTSGPLGLVQSRPDHTYDVSKWPTSSPGHQAGNAFRALAADRQGRIKAAAIP